ncbi:protein of unknown function [Taphrina deformans PYCC 5710]|uniref:Transcription initiation factor IIE subunit alpha n=1 Tax=Taphrina deformans (strain PYCC 5710 / ATCC 11124 / CBS 356.35 / IMI 108563 / JCM 9778 / NBRC 8474) TaxID=1097556 RepID=R4XFP7_TAPDE|nr:protein of unknown function [Taphrina deformans PYCC 5710]|eukprot:CCG84498.1 protein of unknown function [Taphrina deformans PYCC 5710]
MISRTYYFVENRDAIDAIKYRIHRLVRVIEEQSKNDFESKGYVCPYCQRRYGALDVLSLVSSDGQNFECADCRSVLADDEESMESKVSQERLGRLQKQTQQLVSTLKQIDNSFVPDNDFTSALASAIPPNLEHLNVDTQSISLPGLYDNGNTTRTTTAALDVRIDYNVNQQDSAEEKARKSAQAQMNALPEWHLQSTVSGEVIAGRTNGTTFQHVDDIKDVQLDAAASDQVAEYYKALRSQQLVGNSISEAEDEEDDDDGEEAEEDDFEDVPNASGIKTYPIHSAQDVVESEDEFEDVD